MPANAVMKQRARELLNGRWNEHVAVSMLLILLVFICGAVTGLFGSSTGALVMAFFVGAILEVFMGLFIDGAYLYFLHLLHKEKTSLLDVIAPVRMQPDRFLIIELLRIGVFLVIWSPSYLASLLYDRSPVFCEVFTWIWLPVGLCLCLALWMIFGFSRLLLLEQENLGALASLKKSREMMKKQFLKLLGFLLPYIGYLLLAVFSLGLGFLWAIPYFMTGYASFYEELKKSSHNA
ncbi:MAG: DUF975 family protein [Lachnospiraceae bacterium]|nr:DUF975 family protein [Lachnospiraceae bacterium]